MGQHVTFGYQKAHSNKTSWQYSGISVTIPANSMFIMVAKASWSSGKPAGIGINRSASAFDESVADAIYTGTGWNAVCAGVTNHDVSETYCVWHKSTANMSSGGLSQLVGWYAPRS